MLLMNIIHDFMKPICNFLKNCYNIVNLIDATFFNSLTLIFHALMKSQFCEHPHEKNEHLLTLKYFFITISGYFMSHVQSSKILR